MSFPRKSITSALMIWPFDKDCVGICALVLVLALIVLELLVLVVELLLDSVEAFVTLCLLEELVFNDLKSILYLFY